MKKSTITDLPNDIKALIPEWEKNNHIKKIIGFAEQGVFHDFTCDTASPKLELIGHLKTAKDIRLIPIIKAVKNGDYDEPPTAFDIDTMKAEWMANGGTEQSWKAFFENN